MTGTKEPEIPRIEAKIIRSGDKIKIAVGKYSITLNPLPDTTQSYDFVTLKQFITSTAKLHYAEIIKKEQVKKDIRAAFTDKAEEASEQEMISKLLGDK